MSLTEEQIQVIATAVAGWRTQESIYISFYAFYIYYVLTTLDEEAQIILPQRWTRGKALFLAIRYGTCFYITLQLSRDYRTYFAISLISCKVLLLAYHVAYRIAVLACDVVLGLCLSALIQAKAFLLCFVMLLCMAPSFVGFVFDLIADIQYPAEPVSSLDEELGYPCYVPTSEEWTESTVTGIGRDVRRYFYFASTSLLLMLTIATIVVQFKGRPGRLVQVIRRDGGRYYIALASLRFGQAILNTPAILSVKELDNSAVYHFLQAGTAIVIPVLAQRLMVNMRKVDFIGSRPIASTLLFAPPQPGSEEHLGDGLKDSVEMSTGTPDICPRASASSVATLHARNSA